MRIKQFLQITLLLLMLFLISSSNAFAGQGGGTSSDSGSPLPFIIGGLVIVILASGVGLVVARRKKQ